MKPVQEQECKGQQYTQHSAKNLDTILWLSIIVIYEKIFIIRKVSMKIIPWLVLLLLCLPLGLESVDLSSPMSI
jgi:hypothetical protein